MQAARMAAQQSQAERSQLAIPAAAPYQAGFEQRWPEMLGSIPHEEGLIKMSLQNGRSCPIIALSTQPCDPTEDDDRESQPYVACLSLSPASWQVAAASNTAP